MCVIGETEEFDDACDDFINLVAGVVNGAKSKGDRSTARALSTHRNKKRTTRSGREMDPSDEGRQPEPWHMLHGTCRCITHIGHGNF